MSENAGTSRAVGSDGASCSGLPLAIAFALFVSAVPQSRADHPSAWMSEAEVRAVLVDRQVAGTLPDATPWTEFTRADGSTAYVEGNRPLDGRWHFDRHGQLCYRYLDGGGGCFRYLRLSANCFEHFFKEDGEPILTSGPTAELATNGPLWQTSAPSTCEARPSS